MMMKRQLITKMEEVFRLARGCCEVKEAVGMEVEVESLSAILK
jgi:hypothetical protein